MASLPELADLPALTAYLLGGTAGRAIDAASRRRIAGGGGDEGEARAVVAHLAARRLAGEAAASSRLDAAGLSRATRRALALERERLRAGAVPREAAVRRCGEALSSAGLRALLYKGEALVRLTHGDVSRRPMADVDVIVRASERSAARGAVLAHGFRATRHDSALHDVFVAPRGSGKEGMPRAGSIDGGAAGATKLSDVIDGVVFELHADVFSPPHPFAHDLDAVWARSRPSELPGLSLPSEADALVLGAFHLVLHERDGTKGFMTLRDLALLADAGAAVVGEGFAREVAARARAWDLGPVVAEAGRRAVAWAGAPPWLAQVGSPFTAARARRALALRLVLAELDRGLAADAPPPWRVLPRRWAAALWPKSPLRSAKALVDGVIGPPGARRLRLAGERILRHLRSLTSRS